MGRGFTAFCRKKIRPKSKRGIKVRLPIHAVRLGNFHQYFLVVPATNIKPNTGRANSVGSGTDDKSVTLKEKPSKATLPLLLAKLVNVPPMVPVSVIVAASEVVMAKLEGSGVYCVHSPLLL
jgi:hypothetical protein